METDNNDFPVGSYGIVFLPKESRLKPNVEKVCKEIIHNSIRDSIPEFDESLSSNYKRYANRYGVGVDDPLVDFSYIVDTKGNAVRNPVDDPLRLSSKDDSLYRHQDKEKRLGLVEKISNNEKDRKVKISQRPRISNAIYTQDHVRGGKYFVPNFPDPDAKPCSHSLPSSSLKESIPNYPNRSIVNSSSDSSKLSSLQRTLVECGKLVSVEKISEAEKAKFISDSKVTETRILKDHSNFLRRKHLDMTQSSKVENGSMASSTSTSASAIVSKKKGALSLDSNPSNSTIDMILVTNDSRITSSSSSPSLLSVSASSMLDSRKETKMSKTSMSMSIVNDCIENGSIGSQHSLGSSMVSMGSLGSLNSRSKKTTKRYEVALAEHLHVLNTTSVANPYRNSRLTANNMGAAKASATHPMTYATANQGQSLGSYNLLTKESTPLAFSKPPPPFSSLIKSSNRISSQYDISLKVPTREEVDEALAKLSRKSLLSYDMRIIETGALVKALQDIRHPTPGLAAIVDFHRSCVDAACLNPNSWTLTRNQISSVLSRKVSWFDIEAKQRLLTSYDHHQTGKIRFVRISTALVCCTRPAMTELMSLLIRVQEKKQEKLEKSLSNAASSSSSMAVNDTTNPTTMVRSRSKIESTNSVNGYEKQTEKSNGENVGVLFLLRLIFSLYEDCEGGVDINNSHEDGRGVGMRLEDVVESLSCCVSDISDEVQIEKLAAPVIQTLFELGQREDIVHYRNPDSFLSNNSSMINKKNEEDREDDALYGPSWGNTVNAEPSLILGGESVAWTENREKDKSNDNASLSDLPSNVPQAQHILKHRLLRDLRFVPRVTLDHYLTAIQNNTLLFEEFKRQLSRFREFVHPYSVMGTISYEKSVLENRSYGTRPPNSISSAIRKNFES